MAVPRDLVGKWIHMFEEDDEHGEVYRRDLGDAPLSRRPRERLEIAADGTAMFRTGGADDRLVASAATWSEAQGHVTIRVAQPSGGSRGAKASEYRVVESSHDRLVLRR